MKTVLLIVLLALTYAYATVDSIEIPKIAFEMPEKKTFKDPKLLLGSKNNPNERLLSSTYHYVDESHKIAHTQEILIRLVDYARITRAEGWPGSDSETIAVLDGGLGQNYVKLGYATEKNKSFSYRINVYGELVCAE